MQRRAVAFIGGEGNHSGIGDQEIRAADSHFGGEKIAAERAAGYGDQFGRIVSIARAQFFFEEIGDVFAGEVHGGRDDVIREVRYEVGRYIRRDRSRWHGCQLFQGQA